MRLAILRKLRWLLSRAERVSLVILFRGLPFESRRTL